MPDPKKQSETQLRNIEESSGLKRADFTAAISGAGLVKHGEIMAFLKSDYGLTHGNANLISHLAREDLAGGPAAADELLAAQYQGAKAALMPIYDLLAAFAQGLGDDVETVVQKTGVSFRRNKQFALVQAPSAKRVQLGLNLAATPDDDRISEMKGMCSHRVDLTDAGDVDATVKSWIESAYQQAG